MHSFSASSDLLISAPSIRVWRSLSFTSDARSLPAKSINDSLPVCVQVCVGVFAFVCLAVFR